MLTNKVFPIIQLFFFIIATQLLSNLTHNHITMSYYTKYDMNNYYLWEKSQQHKNGEIHKLYTEERFIFFKIEND